MRTEARIDLEAIQSNVETLRARTKADVMAVVKADGYGHGLVPSARAAISAGATWLGVAFLEEALRLRDAGITAPILSWLAAPGEALTTAIERDIDLSASATWAVDEVAAAAASAGKPARLHLKADTGLSRGGAVELDWPNLVTRAAKASAGGEVEIVGIWSHFAYADAPGHPTIDRQLASFHNALDVAAGLGVVPRVRHLANSAATLTRPDAHFDLVRPGIAVYGLSPVPQESQYGLVPAMTLRTHVALAKRVPAGAGLSYGHVYTAERETGVALIPLGYADGVPRDATNRGPLLLGGKVRTISGRVCMDQFVVDVGDDPVAAGDEVLLFGPGTRGEPTAQSWAETLGTISYEIVTRVGARVPRTYPGTHP
jgi:alanine racemase